MRLAHVLVVHSVDPEPLFRSIPEKVGNWYVHFHGTDRGLAESVRALTESRPSSVFRPHFENRGLSRSWNDAIEQGVRDGCQGAFLLNDDLFFYDGCYEAFVAHAATRCADPGFGRITAVGRETGAGALKEINGQGFSCCVLTAAAIERVGYFDETFVPAYFEDVDYARRLRLSGLAQETYAPVVVEHARSTTGATRRDSEGSTFHQQFRKNEAYYARKWGASGGEVHAVPFGDDRYGLKITADMRAAPYSA